MYTTCLFCQADLGRNEALEAFPVGRRLAYDHAKGRLWVVCRRCERWNLTPQGERWEAMEQAERLYRGTRLRAATDNVGLARLRDGTELVRIGAPLRPEFAAWRYGDQFGRRRRRRLLMTAGAVAAAGVVVVAGPVMGLFSLGGLMQVPNFLNLLHLARQSRTRITVVDGPANVGRQVSLAGAAGARLVADARHGAALVVGTHIMPRSAFWDSSFLGGGPAYTRFEGRDAVRVAARLLPHVNRQGGSQAEVRGAVELLDQAGSADALFAAVALHARRHRGPWAWADNSASADGALSGLAPSARLALEMAAHEEQERRALEGELRDLESAWRRAEEIAAIADDLLLPDALGARLDQLRARSSARAGAPSSPASDSGAASSS